jgi:hypothetical protein
MAKEKSECGKSEQACTDEKCKEHGVAVQKRFRRTHVHDESKKEAAIEE